MLSHPVFQRGYALVSSSSRLLQEVIEALFNSDLDRRTCALGVRRHGAMWSSLLHAPRRGHCVLSLLLCASRWQLHISARRAPNLHCRAAERRYDMHTACIYFQFLSPFITLTVAVGLKVVWGGRSMEPGLKQIDSKQSPYLAYSH